MSIFEDYECPYCKGIALPAEGDKDSPIILVGNAPNVDEIKAGMLGAGASYYILRQEFQFMGYNIDNFRYTNLWLHKANGNNQCEMYSIEKCISEISGRKAVLLMGAEPVEYFTEWKVMDVCGLQVTSNMLSVPIIYGCISPAKVIQRDETVGELRLALTKFIKRCRKDEIL